MGAKVGGFSTLSQFIRFIDCVKLSNLDIFTEVRPWAVRESARVPPRETSVPAPESITRCVARTAKPIIIDVLHNKGMYRY